MMDTAAVGCALPHERARYVPRPAAGGPSKYLVAAPGAPATDQRFEFFDYLEIGRDEADREPLPGQLLLPGQAVSWSHCILTQTPDGRCFVRDVSRNGTRLDGRRLVPNAESEMRVGQRLEVGDGWRFVLAGDAPAGRPTPTRGRTVGSPNLTIATVLVGDIRDYTVLVRRTPSAELQQSVNRVFEALTAAVDHHGGTVKEFQGDAIVAFWEGRQIEKQAVEACHAAIDLDRLARRMASDPSVWSIPDFPLVMDWALATGPVIIDSVGASQSMGLSMIGEAVVLAFRLEKFANDGTGRILACSATRAKAARAFRFTDLGKMLAKGFDEPDHVFALDVGGRVNGTPARSAAQ